MITTKQYKEEAKKLFDKIIAEHGKEIRCVRLWWNGDIDIYIGEDD